MTQAMNTKPCHVRGLLQPLLDESYKLEDSLGRRKDGFIPGSLGERRITLLALQLPNDSPDRVIPCQLVNVHVFSLNRMPSTIPYG